MIKVSPDISFMKIVGCSRGGGGGARRAWGGGTGRRVGRVFEVDARGREEHVEGIILVDLSYILHVEKLTC